MRVLGCFLVAAVALKPKQADSVAKASSDKTEVQNVSKAPPKTPNSITEVLTSKPKVEETSKPSVQKVTKPKAEETIKPKKSFVDASKFQKQEPVVEKSEDKPTEKVIEPTAQQSTDKTVDPAVEKPADKPVEVDADKSTEASKPVEAIEKTEEAAKPVEVSKPEEVDTAKPIATESAPMNSVEDKNTDQKTVEMSAEASKDASKPQETTVDKPVDVQNAPQLVHEESEKKESFVKSFEYHQSLLVCNAFSYDKPAVVERQEENLTGDNPIAYKTCRYMPVKLNEGDRLDFKISEGVGGIFEVTDLPRDDSVLLLVLQRRDPSTALLAFQSFAFPRNNKQTVAQVAVIDTVSGTPAKLVMEEHLGKASETLDFNRVYAISAGDYDADVTFGAEHLGRRALRFVQGRDYVLLRTGTGDQEGHDLVAFPDSWAPAAFGLVCAWLLLA